MAGTQYETKTKAQPNTQEWRERAMAIAERDQLEATYISSAYASYDEEGNGQDRHEYYTVPSRRTAGAVHQVEYRVRTGELTCHCMAGEHGLPCGHVGAVAWHLAIYEANTLTWKRAAGFAAPETRAVGDELLPPAA